MIDNGFFPQRMLLTFVMSRSGTVGGLGGHFARKLFLTKVKENELVTQHAMTTKTMARLNFMLCCFWFASYEWPV